MSCRGTDADGGIEKSVERREILYMPVLRSIRLPELSSTARHLPCQMDLEYELS